MRPKLFALLFLLTAVFLQAQKMGVVDTNYILDRLPDYKSASQRLDAQVRTWQTELQNMQDKYEKMRAAFENEKVLLVGEQLRLRDAELKSAEQELKNLIAARFGNTGEINKLRANLVTPFQDQIWNAIKTVADRYSLGIVLDKSNNISVILLDKKFDYTDRVLDILLKDQKNKPKQEASATENAGRPVIENKKRPAADAKSRFQMETMETKSTK